MASDRLFVTVGVTVGPPVLTHTPFLCRLLYGAARELSQSIRNET